MSSRSRGRRTPWQRLWGFLTSRKVAVALLLATLVILLLSLWIPQVPADLDAAGREKWWAAARTRYGPRLDLYDHLGLMSLFSSPLFLALLSALLLNTLCCTLERLGRLWRTATRRPTIRLPDAAYDRAAWEVPAVSPEQARQAQRRRDSLDLNWVLWFPIDRNQARRALRRGGYRLWEEGGPPHYFYSERFRLAPLGTVLTHLGLFLVPLAALLHATVAWQEPLVLDSRASSPTPLQHRPGCAVQSAGLEVQISSDGQASARGKILVQEGQSPTSAWIAPGASLSACGANLYLQSHGLLLEVAATDAQGRPLETPSLPDNGGLRFPEGVTEGSFDVPALGWHVVVTPSPEALSGAGPQKIGLWVEQAGQVLFDGPVDPREIPHLPGGRLSFRAGYYLALTARYDPGFGCFVAAGLSVVVGSSLTLLFPPRRRWARLTEDGTLQVCLALADEDRRQEEIAALRRVLGRPAGGAP